MVTNRRSRLLPALCMMCAAALAGCATTYNASLVMMPDTVATIDAVGESHFITVENQGPGEIMVSNISGELVPLGLGATGHKVQPGVPLRIEGGDERAIVEIEIRDFEGIAVTGPVPRE